MLLHLSDISSEPLHAQISRQIRTRILSGTLEEGEALPSIRAMAREQHVSVITVQRAYDDLQREGLLNSKKGKGLFVATLSGERKLELAIDRLIDDIEPVIHGALESGVKKRQIL
ncbi:MAG: GntR family transcriptional regulator, partial [bacterium]|nr:GntR family transcriptional regulator [bacterium]